MGYANAKQISYKARLGYFIVVEDFHIQSYSKGSTKGSFHLLDCAIQVVTGRVPPLRTIPVTKNEDIFWRILLEIVCLKKSETMCVYHMFTHTHMLTHIKDYTQ